MSVLSNSRHEGPKMSSFTRSLSVLACVNGSGFKEQKKRGKSNLKMSEMITLCLSNMACINPRRSAKQQQNVSLSSQIHIDNRGR